MSTIKQRFSLIEQITDWPKILALLFALSAPPRRVLLWGVPGTGKTTYALSLAANSERITLTQGMFPDALLGKFLLKDGSTFWADAAMSRAAKKGCPLVIDEINKGGSELDSTLQAGLDDVAVCRLNLDNGETITPADGYRIVATMNGSPDQLAEPVLDRFDIVLNCRIPHEGLLKRMRPASAAFVKNMMLNAPQTDQWTPKPSPRLFLAFDNLVNQGVNEELAAAIIFGVNEGQSILTGMIDAQRNAK